MPPHATPRCYDRGPVLFDEATHTYRVRLGGAEWPIAVSATGLVGRHFAAFDGPAVAARGVARWKAHPVYGPIIRAHPDDPVAAIVAHWDANGRAAAAFGTMVHAWAERWLIGIAAPPPPDAANEAAQVRRFVAAQRAAGFEVAAAELRVFWRSVGPGDDVRTALGPPVLAGMCDALFVGPDGAHTLVDWKCSAKPLDGARAPWTKKGVGCLAHLDDTKLVRYSLQVAPPPCLPQPRPQRSARLTVSPPVQAWLYTLMLEQSRGIRVTTRLIVRLHTAPDPEVVEALELEKEVRALLETLV